MSKALSIIWRGIVDTYNELFSMLGMNVIWFLLTLVVLLVLGIPITLLANVFAPTAGLGFWPLLPLGVLLIVGPNPVAAGLHLYANQLAHDERVEFSMFWQGLRRYWKKSALLCLISVFATFVIVGNIGFYLTRGSQVLTVIGLIFVYLLYFWISVQLYVQPLLIEQDDKSLKTIYRNAAVLAAGSPFVTFILLVVIALFVALGFVLPIIASLLLGSLVVVIANRATVTILEQFRGKRNP